MRKRIKVYATRDILESETATGFDNRVVVRTGTVGYLRAFSEYENYVTVEFEGWDVTVSKSVIELYESEVSNA